MFKNKDNLVKIYRCNFCLDGLIIKKYYWCFIGFSENNCINVYIILDVWILEIIKVDNNFIIIFL